MSNATDVVDLLIIDGDLVLGDNQEPKTLTALDAVVQDLKHKLIESNYLFLLIGERNIDDRKIIYKKIKSLIEDDSRIKAGTVTVKETTLGQLSINALGINGKEVTIQ